MSLKYIRTSTQLIDLVDRIIQEGTPCPAIELSARMANAQAIALCGIAVQLERIADAPDQSERIAQALENIADLVLRKGA